MADVTTPAPQTLAREDPLSELRDIHLPDPVSAWPVAPGWWIVFALLFAAALAAIAASVRYWRGRRYRRQAIVELEGLLRRCGRDGDTHVYVAGCAEILKRVAIAAFPRHEIASLSGEQWVAFLDGSYGGDGFTLGPGQALVDGPYRHGVDVDMEALHEEATTWIRRHRAPRPAAASTARSHLPGLWLRRKGMAG